jgi:transposase
MRKILLILELSLGRGLSQRAVAQSVKVAPSTVADCLRRARDAGLDWPISPELDDAALEGLLYRPSGDPSRPRAQPDFKSIHKELCRKGVTLQLLWEEYKQAHPEDGYQYSQFCERYRQFRMSLDAVLRQDHRAGEKLFVDYSGDGLVVTDPNTGEQRKAHLFVAVLGASNYIYAEATPRQDLRSWLLVQAHTLEFLGAVPEIIVPDNTKTGVTHPCYYDPEINKTYDDFARHYGTVVIPARPRKPRDKAKVEQGVLMAQRMIVAALRNHTFFTFEDLNSAIRALVTKINNRKFKKLDTTRRELFETIDKPAMRPLPSSRFEYAEWSKPRVNIDYHVEVDRHYYSVPYQLIHKQLDARLTATTVELLYKGQRVASHARSFEAGKHTTIREHMPKSHQEYLEWTPSRILRWASTCGPKTAGLAHAIMNSRPHPEHGYRACLGVLRLGKHYGSERLEAACARALALGVTSYRKVNSILKNGLDRVPLPQAPDKPQEAVDHQNIRGPSYYK